MKKKITIFCMTALLLAVLAVTEVGLIQNENNPFSVFVVTQAGSEKIHCWEGDGVYHVFLPSHADLSNVEIQTNRLFPLYWNGKKVEDGTTIQSFFPDETVCFQIRKAMGRYDEVVVKIHRTENTASLFIDTSSGSLDYIHDTKGNEESGQLRLYTADGAQNASAQLRTIKGRGNSTWAADKKPYSLELVTKEDLLGMGAAKKWILLANSDDPSNIGNKMGYEFAAATGDTYAPACQWVDLYLNGEYAGLYLLTERNEVDPQRVDIPTDGSFLLSFEWFQRWDGTSYSGFSSERENFFRIHHAGMPQNRIAEIWQSAENAIYSDDGIDPVTGKHWTQLMDLDSWARQWLLGEVFSENDAGALSQYLYYEPNSGKIFAGPVWDYDCILNFNGNLPANALNCQRRFLWNQEQETVFYRLYQQEDFRQRVQTLFWQEYRPLLFGLAEEKMDGYLEQCSVSAQMNAVRWNARSPEKAVERMKGYLLEHMAFLEDFWTREADYCLIDLRVGNRYATFGIPRGEPATFLDEIPLRESWLNSIIWDPEADAPYDTTVPVTKKRMLLIRIRPD